ncbi:MAG: tyrosine-type recombinase/integrase [Chloroflexi bacterium]|nr:tyrosine-type recombinase/integrase [Chloroflexota bacterium]
MDIVTITPRYVLTAKAEGLSLKTINHTLGAVRYFAKFSGGIEDVRKVTADDLRRFSASLQDKKRWSERSNVKVQSAISRTSINTYVRAIKAFWSWMQRQGIIKYNPLAEVSAPKIPKRLPKILTEDELRALFRMSLSDRDRALLMLLLDSGIRLTELANLRFDDVDLKNDVVSVIGKGDKQRHVFISTDTAIWLTIYACEERPDSQLSNQFFLRNDGYPLIASRIQKILEIIGRKARLKQRLSPHRLRHTYATLSLKNGANLEFLRRSLGHTDLKTTEVYLTLSDADVQAAHKQFSPVKNLGI